MNLSKVFNYLNSKLTRNDTGGNKLFNEKLSNYSEEFLEKITNFKSQNQNNLTTFMKTGMDQRDLYKYMV